MEDCQGMHAVIMGIGACVDLVIIGLSAYKLTLKSISKLNAERHDGKTGVWVFYFFAGNILT
jgi:hypothetical protein